MTKWIAPVFTGVVVGVLLLPGTAQASLSLPESHSGSAVAYTVKSGDVAWRIAERLCGAGRLHSSLLIRSVSGVTRYDHDRIWPTDRVTGWCGKAQSAPRVSVPSAGWVAPLSHFYLTSCFGMRKLASESTARMHYGLDLAAPYGTAIRAAAAGTVTEVDAHSGYGISVTISHGGNVRTFYGHMSSRAVHRGQPVKAGQVIGRVGSTGYSFGNHLHFGMHYGLGGGYRDSNPAPWLRRHGVRIGC